MTRNLIFTLDIGCPREGKVADLIVKWLKIYFQEEDLQKLNANAKMVGLMTPAVYEMARIIVTIRFKEQINAINQNDHWSIDSIHF